MATIATTKTAAALQQIRSAIEAGRLSPAQRIRVIELVDMLHMSPTPIREALRLLQAEGLIVYEPHHGMMVRPHPGDQLDDINHMRRLLEPEAVRLATINASPQQVRNMARLNERFVALAKSGSASAGQVNLEWHRAIYAASGSQLLVETINRLWGLMPRLTMWSQVRAEPSIREHSQIMVAIEGGQADAAADAMRQHLDSAFAGDAEVVRLLTHAETN